MLEVDYNQVLSSMRQLTPHALPFTYVFLLRCLSLLFLAHAANYRLQQARARFSPFTYCTRLQLT
jgi:hypothetical protein